MSKLKFMLLAILLTLTGNVFARDPAQVRNFRRHNPCPATHKISGACPGYVVDHLQSLCSGGLDAPSNMRWQAYKESLVKDAEERRYCRKLRAMKLRSKA